MVQQPPPIGPGSPHFRGFTMTHTPQSVGLLRTSDQPYIQTSTWQHTNFTWDRRARGGIRTRSPSANERPQTHAVDRTVTEIGLAVKLLLLYLLSRHQFYSFLRRMIEVMLAYGDVAQLIRPNDVLYV